jgi:hypothetical protein
MCPPLASLPPSTPPLLRFGLWPLVSGPLGGPRPGRAPGLETSGGAFVDLLQNPQCTFCRHYRSRGRSGNLLQPLLLRWNGLGGCPCRHGGLWPHSGVLLTCSGAACFQNMEVRVLCESAPVPVAVKASERRVRVREAADTKGCNDVAVDGLGQAYHFLASLGLPFALRGHLGEGITDEAWGLGPGKARWHKYGKPEVRVDSRKIGPLIQAIVSLSRMCAVSQIFRFPRCRCR